MLKAIIVGTSTVSRVVTVWTKRGMMPAGEPFGVAEPMYPQAAQFARRRLEEQEVENCRTLKAQPTVHFTVIPVEVE